MKNLLLILALVSSNLVFGITGNKVWRVPSGGTLPSWGPINLADATNAVTGLLSKSNLASVGQQLSSSSGTFSSSSSSYTDVTNLSVSLTTGGRPVVLKMISSGGTSFVNPSSCSPSGTNCTIKFLRDSSTVAVYQYNTTLTTGVLEGFDPVAGGTYTYKIQAKSDGSHTFIVSEFVLLAYEM